MLIIGLGTIPGLFDVFAKQNATYQRISKGIEKYLSAKRFDFPRFFFLSDESLMKLLSETANDKRAIQPFLLQLFDAVSRVSIDDSYSIV